MASPSSIPEEDSPNSSANDRGLEDPEPASSCTSALPSCNDTLTVAVGAVASTPPDVAEAVSATSSPSS